MSLISAAYDETIQSEYTGNGVKKVNVCALIPSYDPDERLISTVEDLRAAGFHHIIVVDDGSRPDCQPGGWDRRGVRIFYGGNGGYLFHGSGG